MYCNCSNTRQPFKGVAFYLRLKKIQDKKRISRAKAELEKAKRKAEGKIEDEAANILDDAHDEDVLFWKRQTKKLDAILSDFYVE